ncbi:YjbH domain-containing protein [Thiomicrospira microaerophila]|uniref:YjbH domain-containing protein n=1 Tax=Thiomicrospira microaerophila TaxID=406020 RepID=UPI0005CA7A1A|nr:YjbH domain-containing protein [Thiomicrospira microaerophila]
MSLSAKKNTLLTSILLMPLFSSASLAYNINSFGVTGLFNIPTADVADFGDFSLSYNNVLDASFRRDQYTRGENINVSLGIYPKLEVNLRLLHAYSTKDHQKNRYANMYIRDLSGNVKLQLPYISNDKWRFAVGATDIAGLAVNFNRYYAVSSYRLYDFDFSVGYSVKPEKQRRDNGVLIGGFAGMSYQPTDWLQLNAEKDASGQRAGVALKWIDFLGFEGDITFGAMLYNSHPSEPRAFNIGLTWPVGGRNPGSDKMQLKSTPMKSKAVKQPISGPYSSQPNALPQSTASVPSRPIEYETQKQSVTDSKHQHIFSRLPKDPFTLRAQLEEVGLDRIQIGESHASTLVIAYENRLYNWSETLAMGALLNTLAKSTLIQHYEHIDIYTLNRGMPVLNIQVSSADLINLVQHAQTLSPAKARTQVAFKHTHRLPQADWFFKSRTNEKIDITLTLAYRAYYGTEWSNWDYSMAFRPVFNIPLWKGAHISNVYHLATQNTYGFEENRIFSSKAFSDQMVELMIHQSFQPFPGLVNTISAGELKMGNNGFRGVMNQGEYQLFSGYGRVYWRQGYMEANKLEDVTLDYNAIGLEAHWQQRKLILGIQAGDYIEGDRSTILYSRVRMGNALVGLGLTQSDMTWRRVDMSFMFPLGPSRNLALGPITLGGDPLWYTGLGTVTDNPIAPSMNLIDTHPQYKLVGASLGNSFNQSVNLLDNARLTPAYLKNNLNQLLDAIELAK